MQHQKRLHRCGRSAAAVLTAALLAVSLLLTGCGESTSSSVSSARSPAAGGRSAAADQSAPDSSSAPADDPITASDPDDAGALAAAAERFDPAGLNFDLSIAGVKLETADIDTLAAALGLSVNQQGQTRYAGQWGEGVSIDQNVERERILSCTLDAAVQPGLQPTADLAGIAPGDTAGSALAKLGFGPNTAAYLAPLEDLEFSPSADG